MLKTIKDELNQYTIRNVFNIKPTDILKMSNKNLMFEKGKKYYAIIIDNNNNWIRAICWLGLFEHDKYKTNFYVFSSHIYAKYRGSDIEFYETEQTFSSEKLIEILLNIFANNFNNKTLFFSDKFALVISNCTIGDIYIDFSLIDYLLDDKLAKFYPEKINFNNEFIYCYCNNK